MKPRLKVPSIMAALTESFVSGGIFGETTKALRQSWNQRVVETDQDILVDELNILQLFNDLKLFPSKSQVFEMVHCAREGSRVGILCKINTYF